MVGNVMAGKTLTIILAADISRLSRGLRSAQGDLDTFDGRVNRLGSQISGSLVPAAIGAAAAVGTLAVAMAVQGVQGALADEAAVAKLSKTLDNLGKASDTQQIETFIDALSRSAGVADDLLRPAYDRLIRSTLDVGLANSGLALSLNIAQGTGKSLESVTNALGKAYDGSTTSLGKLGTGLDKATLATGDMELITSKLAQTFGGQAATQAETFQGKLARLSVGFDELKEAFGYGFLAAFDDASGGMDNFLKGLKDLEPQLKIIGTAMGNLTIATANLGIQGTKNLSSFLAVIDTPSWSNFSGLLNNIGKSLTSVGALLPSWARDSGTALQFLTSETEQAAQFQTGLINTVGMTVTAFRAEETALGRNKTALQIYQESLVEAAKVGAATAAVTKINTEALDAQNDVLDKSLDKLRSETDALKAAEQAYTDYWKTLSGKITGGIDLVGAFKDAVAAGEDPASALGAVFDQQDWYTNILAALKNGGATQAVIDAVTEGGLAGGVQLGQGILDLGLIPYLNENLYRVENTADAIAKSLVPPFILAGQQQAITNLDAMSKEVLESGAKLKQIGKNIGKPISNQITKEISEALKQAWIDIDAAKSAAEAAAIAAGAARRVVVSDQQAIQQLNQILANGNARAGYQESVVIA